MCDTCGILRFYVRHVRQMRVVRALLSHLGRAWDAKKPPPTWGEGLHLLFADYFHRHFPVMAQRAFKDVEALPPERPALVGQLVQSRVAHGASLVPVRRIGKPPVYSHASASGSRVPITRPKPSSRGVMPPRSETMYCAPVSGSVTT